MDSLFPIADRLRELRDAKKDLEEQLKEVNAEIKSAERALTDAMALGDCPNFTRGDRQFIMTTTTRWSQDIDRKDELYALLREKGYDYLFSVNPKALGTFVRERIAETEDANGETHIPEWLDGLVKNYEDVGVTMKPATKKSK